MAKQFSSAGLEVKDALGRTIATAVSEIDARVIAMRMNFHDRLYAALKQCRGEFELMSMPIKRPAYSDLVALAIEIENEFKSPQ